MSARFMTQAFKEKGLAPLDKFVLIQIADACCADIELIVEECGITKDEAEAIVQKLKQLGLIDSDGWFVAKPRESWSRRTETDLS